MSSWSSWKILQLSKLSNLNIFSHHVVDFANRFNQDWLLLSSQIRSNHSDKVQDIQADFDNWQTLCDYIRALERVLSARVPQEEVYKTIYEDDPNSNEDVDSLCLNWEIESINWKQRKSYQLRREIQRSEDVENILRHLRGSNPNEAAHRRGMKPLVTRAKRYRPKNVRN